MLDRTGPTPPTQTRVQSDKMEALIDATYSPAPGRGTVRWTDSADTATAGTLGVGTTARTTPPPQPA
ncbi:hypothetical protein ABYF34_02940 [Buchananella felis]|uniref:hypothetical protein n=1 Tax=Buchananella felis TaxID=3231492 RepID=UPI003529C71C